MKNSMNIELLLFVLLQWTKMLPTMTECVPGLPCTVTAAGPEFHRQLENPLVFRTELEAGNSSESKFVAQLPRYIQGKTKTQVCRVK